MRKKIIFISFLVIVSRVLFSQQMPLISQYKLNGFIYNPALAGIEQSLIGSVIVREQWVGYDNAPRTLWANCQARISNKHFGVGGSIFNDRDGLISNTGIQGMYSYHIPLSNGQLSLGASLLMYQYKINKTEIIARDPLDPTIFNNPRYFTIDAGVGAYYKAPSYYGGLSVSNVMQSAIKIGSDDLSNNKTKRIYYLTGGYYYKINSDLTIEPHTLIRYTQGYKAQMDINCAVMYQLQYWAGLGYRTSGDLLFFIGGTYQNFLVGYAFDYALTNMHKRNYSSHEIMASVRFGKAPKAHSQGSDIY